MAEFTENVRPAPVGHQVKYFGAFHFVHEREGQVLWQDECPNALLDEGEENIIKTMFDETATVPVNYYVGLTSQTIGEIAETATLGDITGEPVGNGYARQAVASNNTDIVTALDAGDWQATLTEKTFTASGGNWGTMNVAFLTNKTSGSAEGVGKLLSTAALSTARTINDGDSLKVRYRTKLQ